jgi:hypothetical protein
MISLFLRLIWNAVSREYRPGRQRPGHHRTQTKGGPPRRGAALFSFAGSAVP